jgi:hypothetical protein
METLDCKKLSRLSMRSPEVMSFWDLWQEWKWARISDAEFIARAEEVGKALRARALVAADFEET